MHLKLINVKDYGKSFELDEKSDLHLFMSHTKPRLLREGTEPDDSLRLYRIEEGGSGVGIVWLEDITEVDGKLGIYIYSEQYRGQGIGERAIREVLEVAFNSLNLKKVYLNVRGENVRAIKCYKKCGFLIVEEYDKQRFSDGSFQNAYKLECLAR